MYVVVTRQAMLQICLLIVMYIYRVAPKIGTFFRTP